MPRVTFKSTDPKDTPERRSVFEVLGLPNEGPSPRGSTFHKMMMICPREWALYYTTGLRPTVLSEPLTVGWLFHYCLQRYYEQIKAYQDSVSHGNKITVGNSDFYWGGANDGMGKAFEIVDRIESEPGYGDTGETLRRVLDAYFDHYHHQDKWRIVAIEETLGYEGAWEYTARLDLIIEDHDRGGLWDVEHKTARYISADLLDNYQLDIQILGQVWLIQNVLAAGAYPDFRGVRVNIATKHKTPQLTRVDVCPSPQHLQAFEATIGQQRALREVMRQLDYPQYLGHCSGYARGYSRCQFYDVCMGHPLTTVEQWKIEEPPFGFVREEVLVR